MASVIGANMFVYMY